MTKDVIALTPAMPDTMALLTGLYAGGPDLGVSAGHDGAVIQLRAADGRPLVSLEAPLLVQVPGEAERLLGIPAVCDGPYWWTEVRASTAVPEAERLAGSVAGRLTALLGGGTWPRGVGSTDVVEVGGGDGTDAEAGGAAEGGSGGAGEDISGGAAAGVYAEAGDGQPAVDVLTDSTAVVLADRPVVPLTAWLSDILRTTVASGRALQIVTPPHVRLGLPLRAALTGAPNRWVVQDPDCGYYDGLSGAVLRWQDGTFAPARTEEGETAVADAFADATVTGERQLVVSFRAVHAPDEALVLGGALRTAWTALTGSGPAGWGTAEPVNLPWSERQLTDLARKRAPEPTQLLAVGTPGRPGLATLRVTRTGSGVTEEATLTLGYGPDEHIPLDAVEPLARTLVAGHHLATMLVTLRRARRDLTVPAHFEAPPIPVAFTLGADDVRAVGVERATRTPVEVRPVRLGAAGAPAVHYPLGEGTDAAVWGDFQRLMEHLRAGAPTEG
ncbi:DUF6177 family protein [Streptomyces gamaensis]|uniref:DUF6177 family protein n=1 Tax=Streptomyces gamaensis TaxID=1763542 RepID=A0ABW0Z4S2_9ACTN